MDMDMALDAGLGITVHVVRYSFSSTNLTSRNFSLTHSVLANVDLTKHECCRSMNHSPAKLQEDDPL